MAEAAASAGPSIYVMYGSRRRVVDEILRLAPPRSPIAWLADHAGARHAWQGVRWLVASAAAAVPPSVFEGIIARHRLVLAVLYPERADELAAGDHAGSRALCADSRSHYAHSTASWQPLIRAAGELIADLLAASGAIVAVPELADLDAQTGHALLDAFREHRARLAGLRIGHDPELARDPLRVWGVPVEWRIEQVRAQLLDYQLCPARAVVRLQGPGRSDPVPGPPANPWSAPTPYCLALAVLGGAGRPRPAELARCVSAMRWSVETFAFGQAFRLGVLLEPYRDLLDRDGQAAHASLTAIAATNAHFVDRPTPGFDEPLYAMYERAIELCTDPVELAALSVALAFAIVERGGPRAGSYLERAAWRIGRVESELAAQYHGAWLAVAHALHHLHRADWTATELHARTACAAFTEVAALASAELPRPCAMRVQREAACGRFMVLAHGAIHASTKSALAARWARQAEQEQTDVPAVVLFEVSHWVLLPQGDDADHPLTLERCRAGIRDAERCWDFRSWYVYRSVAADCAYRMGWPDEASEHCRRLLAAKVVGSPEAALIADVRGLAFRALLRAGDFMAVLELANGCLVDPPDASHAEAHAIMALALGARGDRSGALSALDRAIDQAVARGERAVMLRVATRAVEVMALLNEHGDAKQALDQAWDLAEDEAGEFSEAISPPDRLRLCVLHARELGVTSEILSRAFSLLPSCMTDAESWWDTTELLDQAIGWCRGGGALPAGARAGLSAIRRLARNRTGWEDRLRVLDAEELAQGRRRDVCSAPVQNDVAQAAGADTTVSRR